MINRLKLEYKIKESGHTNKECAEKLNISLQAFLNKLNNKSEFKYSEILKLCDYIGIDIKDSIFFESKV